MLTQNEVEATSIEITIAEEIEASPPVDSNSSLPVQYYNRHDQQHTLFSSEAKKPKKKFSQVKTAIALAAGGATTLQTYPILSWQAGNNIPASLTMAFCSGFANWALSSDKFSVTIDRLPEFAQLLAGTFKTVGGFGHLLADAFFVFASTVGSISLTNITYELYEKQFLLLALIPAGLLMLGRIVIGTSALVDLKNNILWWADILRDPNFKAKEELILLLNDIQPLIKKCTPQEVDALKTCLDKCTSEEEKLSCFVKFAESKDINLTSVTLLDKSLWIRLAIFIVIGIPASIIYYHKAAVGISTALDLSVNDWRAQLFSALSVLPILTLQGMASQKAIYEIMNKLFGKIQNGYAWATANMTQDMVNGIFHNYWQIVSNSGEWLKERLTSQSIYYALRAPAKFGFNLKMINTVIGIGSCASAVQIAITAAGGSVPLLILYIPPAAAAASLTNILSMHALTDKLTTKTTAEQEELIADIDTIKTYLSELYIHNGGKKLTDLREQIEDTPDHVIIDIYDDYDELPAAATEQLSIIDRQPSADYIIDIGESNPILQQHYGISSASKQGIALFKNYGTLSQQDSIHKGIPDEKKDRTLFVKP